MKKSYLLGGGLTLVAALLSACNSNDDDGSHTTKTTSTPTPAVSKNITVTPSLGKILNAKVVLRNAKTGVELGTGNTGTIGSAVVKITPTTDPVVAEIQLPQGTQYFDEAKNALATVATDTNLRAVLPTIRDSLGVTPLTDLAYQAALKAATTEKDLTTSIINQANTQIQQTLATGIPDILIAPTVLADNDLSNDITIRNAANSYALILAALAKLGNPSNATPMIDALTKLSQDMSDGVFNGNDGVTGISYTLPSESSLAEAINQYFKAIAQATAALKALYTDGILNSFAPNFNHPISVVYQGGDKFGAMLATSPQGFQQLHIATGFSDTTAGDVVTAKWTETGSSFTVVYNKATSVIQSVKIQSNSSNDFLQCLNTSCSGLSLNLSKKQLTATNFQAAVNTVPNTTAFTFNGLLSLGTPIPTFDVAVGGVVTAADLNAIAGTYSISGGNLISTVRNSANPTSPPVVTEKENVTCSVTLGNGKATISGGGISLTTAPSASSVVSAFGSQKRFTLVSVDANASGGSALDVGFTNGKLTYASATLVNLNVATLQSTTHTLICTNFN